MPILHDRDHKEIIMAQEKISPTKTSLDYPDLDGTTLVRHKTNVEINPKSFQYFPLLYRILGAILLLPLYPFLMNMCMI